MTLGIDHWHEHVSAHSLLMRIGDSNGGARDRHVCSRLMLGCGIVQLKRRKLSSSGNVCVRTRRAYSPLWATLDP